MIHDLFLSQLKEKQQQMLSKRTNDANSNTTKDSSIDFSHSSFNNGVTKVLIMDNSRNKTFSHSLHQHDNNSQSTLHTKQQQTNQEHQQQQQQHQQSLARPVKMKSSKTNSVTIDVDKIVPMIDLLANLKDMLQNRQQLQQLADTSSDDTTSQSSSQGPTIDNNNNNNNNNKTMVKTSKKKRRAPLPPSLSPSPPVTPQRDAGSDSFSLGSPKVSLPSSLSPTPPVTPQRDAAWDTFSLSPPKVLLPNFRITSYVDESCRIDH